MAAWTKAALLTGESDEHFVAALGAADASEAEVQVAATKEASGDLADDRSPATIALCVALGVRPFELRQVTFDGAIEGRVTGPARAIDRRFGCTANHDS